MAIGQILYTGHGTQSLTEDVIRIRYGIQQVSNTAHDKSGWRQCEIFLTDMCDMHAIKQPWGYIISYLYRDKMDLIINSSGFTVLTFKKIIIKKNNHHGERVGGGLRREGADVEEGDRRRGGGTSKRGIVEEGDVVEGDVEEEEGRRRWEEGWARR